MRNHKLLYQSSYDRGLEYLLYMWPDIRAKYKDATLDIAYGWNTFDQMLAHNAERQQWKGNMVAMMTQPGIKHHGRIGKDELKKLRQECGILAYPGNFYEIFCIGVVEAQLDGCVPVTTSIGALSETVQCGVVVDGDINDKEIQKLYLKELMSLMGDEGRRSKLAKKGMEWAKRFDWPVVAKAWSDVFKEKDESVKVTVFTPTIRRGWWNLMADNLNKQTYKNFEWIIVDDYPEDRSKIAKEYAVKYNLDIKYFRGTRGKVKRTYNLARANNTAMEKATGEVLVFLQDFIIIPLDGLEQIATLYRREPEALQCLPDMYFTMKEPIEEEKEDWFNGETHVTDKFIRQNVRIANAGLRTTNNCKDFEQNYGAIPLKIARELGGWWEFYDEALGYDNVDIAYRALLKGYKLIIDETNVAICLDLWPIIGGKEENGGKERSRRFNDPRFYWMGKMIKEGKMSLVRTQKEDDKIDLHYDIPKELPDDEVEDWMFKNLDSIVNSWV